MDDGVVVRRWRTQVNDEHGMPTTVEVVEARVFDDLLARNAQTEKDLSELVDVVSELRTKFNEHVNKMDRIGAQGTGMQGAVPEMPGS